MKNDFHCCVCAQAVTTDLQRLMDRIREILRIGPEVDPLLAVGMLVSSNSELMAKYAMDHCDDLEAAREIDRLKSDLTRAIGERNATRKSLDELRQKMLAAFKEATDAPST